MLNGKKVLVTGGTGSFGKKFVEIILKRYPGVEKVVVFSRDELKQFEMSQLPFFRQHADKIRYFLGDVRDYNRLQRAFEYIDVVIHAAALKQVPSSEYNPFECIKTNVLGAQNVIEACLDTHVEKVVALSTDKAAAPVNLYGATKLCSDKLFVAANNIKGTRNLKFSVVRYGNVFGSRGSVVPFFLDKKKSGTIPITHVDMTRFNISLEEGVDMVLFALENAWGGEIFVPKLPSYNIMTLAEAIAPGCKTEIVGIRPGEKLHEEMITESDAPNTVDCGKYFVILPNSLNLNAQNFCKTFKAKKVPAEFRYNSGENTEWLAVASIRALMSTYAENETKVKEIVNSLDMSN